MTERYSDGGKRGKRARKEKGHENDGEKEAGMTSQERERERERESSGCR